MAIQVLASGEELSAANRLFSEIWASNGAEPVMPTTLLTAFAHSGNYVAGAFREGELVGASAGFLGQDTRRVHLHSHITGVAPSLQGRSVGFALKQHQRAWALARGLDEITWTFDPLVGRNGYFNIAKLGAEIVGYHENFYGELDDVINRDDESDRCLVAWPLASHRAVDASEGRHAASHLDTSAALLLDADAAGFPILTRQEAPVLLASIPRDILEVRRDKPEDAAAWRVALRGALGWAIDRGYAVTGMTREGQYVLTNSR